MVMVLSMHHSGTSLLTRILMQAGLYGGSRSAFKLQAPKDGDVGRLDPPKYWERLDVIAATELLINRSVSDASVHLRDAKLGWLTGFAFAASSVQNVVAQEYRDQMRAVVDLLLADVANRSTALVLKEPRLSLTWPFWRPVLSDASLRPICVILHRHPMLVATGLRWRPRNRAMLLQDWLALWEKYMVGTLRACHGIAKVIVSHDALARAPAATVQETLDQLRSLGVPDLLDVEPAWLRQFLPSYNATPHSNELDDLLTVRQRRLWQFLNSAAAADDSAEFVDGDVDAMSERELAGVESYNADKFDSLRTALDAVADAERNVVVIPSNTFFSDLARNQVCSIRAVAPSVRPIALGLDDHFCDSMSGIDAACFYDRSFGVGVTDLARWTLDPSSQYMTILLLKMAYVEKAINFGYNVLLADADIAWRADARAALLRQAAANPEVDLLIQSDARRNVAEKRHWLCAGFFYMRANERTSMFMQATREIMLAFGAPDQDVWQLLLRGTGQNVKFPSEWKSARKGGKPWLDAAELGMSYVELNGTEYANGGRFFSSEDIPRERAAAIIAHANMRGFPMKVKAFQHHGLWHVDKLNCDRCL